jgi:hypothetical protein
MFSGQDARIGYVNLGEGGDGLCVGVATGEEEDTQTSSGLKRSVVAIKGGYVNRVILGLKPLFYCTSGVFGLPCYNACYSENLFGA